MSYSATTLEDIISTSFDGKKSLLAKTCDLAPRVITRLTQDQSFTPETLDRICKHLSEEDAKRLCYAACRDLLPSTIAKDLTYSESSSILEEPRMLYNRADEKTEAILQRLRTLVMKDPESREWLHQTAKWIFPEDPELHHDPKSDLQKAVDEFKAAPPLEAEQDKKSDQAQ